jgi:hypothetical protein
VSVWPRTPERHLPLCAPHARPRAADRPPKCHRRRWPRNITPHTAVPRCAGPSEEGSGYPCRATPHLPLPGNHPDHPKQHTNTQTELPPWRQRVFFFFFFFFFFFLNFFSNFRKRPGLGWWWLVVRRLQSPSCRHQHHPRPVRSNNPHQLGCCFLLRDTHGCTVRARDFILFPGSGQTSSGSRYQTFARDPLNGRRNAPQSIRHRNLVRHSHARAHTGTATGVGGSDVEQI